MSLSLPRNIKDLSYLRFVDVLKLKLVSGRKKNILNGLRPATFPHSSPQESSRRRRRRAFFLMHMENSINIQFSTFDALHLTGYLFPILNITGPFNCKILYCTYSRRHAVNEKYEVSKSLSLIVYDLYALKYCHF